MSTFPFTPYGKTLFKKLTVIPIFIGIPQFSFSPNLYLLYFHPHHTTESFQVRCNTDIYIAKCNNQLSVHILIS